MEEERVKIFLQMAEYKLWGKDIAEKIKNLCIAKICDVIGINCEKCYNSKVFQIYASILGEAVCVKLMTENHVLNEELRCVSFNGVNFVEKSTYFLNIFEVNEAILDIFNLVDDHKEFLLTVF